MKVKTHVKAGMGGCLKTSSSSSPARPGGLSASPSLLITASATQHTSLRHCMPCAFASEVLLPHPEQLQGVADAMIEAEKPIHPRGHGLEYSLVQKCPLAIQVLAMCAY